MGAYSQLTREEIISWLRERQSHWMTQNYNRAAAMLEAEAAENETLREWHLASQAEIARLQAELDAVKEARDMMGRLWQSARNDALEEAAIAMSPFLRSMISRGEAARIIRALKDAKP